MAALRDSENILLDFEGDPNETTSIETFADEACDWYRKTGYYSSVTWYGDRSLEKIKALVKTPTNHIDLIIKEALLPGHENSKYNHVITLEDPMVFDETSYPATVSFKYWTWGRVETRTFSVDELVSDYLAAIVAELALEYKRNEKQR